jgi:hypothetical protein
MVGGDGPVQFIRRFELMVQEQAVLEFLNGDLVMHRIEEVLGL